MTATLDTVHAAEIRNEANYAGVRIILLGVIDGARVGTGAAPQRGEGVVAASSAGS